MSSPIHTAWGDHGPVRFDDVTPNSVNCLAPAAAARWLTPESLHTTSRACRVSAAKAPSPIGGKARALGAALRAWSASFGGTQYTTSTPSFSKACVKPSYAGHTLIRPLCNPVAVGAIRTNAPSLNPCVRRVCRAVAVCASVNGSPSDGGGSRGTEVDPHVSNVRRVSRYQD